MLPFAASAADETPLTKEQIKQFLQTAEIIKSAPSTKGVTHPWRLTLSNGTIVHDAAFQPVDEHKAEMKLESGKVELGFVDSYKYNIAAYRLAELVGLDDLLPVYVERNWKGKTGSLGWWLPVKMDDAERIVKKLEPPNPEKKALNSDELTQKTKDYLTKDEMARRGKIVATFPNLIAQKGEKEVLY